MKDNTERDERMQVLFLCGSPKGRDSSSYAVARYLAGFLDADYEFIDVAEAGLSFDAGAAEPVFERIVRKMDQAAVVVWTFGAICWHAPIPLKLLWDKLFTQNKTFEGKIALSLMSGAHFLDDYILETVQYISEQLGFGYLGDVSADGLPGGYADYRETEDACRVLARQINQALASGYVPCRSSAYAERKDLSALHYGDGFEVADAAAYPAGGKRLLVITGVRLEKNPAATSIFETIRRCSGNTVELVEIETTGVRACQLNYQCLLKDDITCVQQDAFETIKAKMKAADGIVYIGHCASAFVDAHLQTFITRTGSMLVMPQLKGKYGFVVTAGGGPLGRPAALFLDKVLRRYGVHSIAALTHNDHDAKGFPATLQWAVRNLDQALAEQWRLADRFTCRAEHYFMRENAARFGMIFRGLYGHGRREKIFDFPPYRLTKVLWFFLRSERMIGLLMAWVQKLTARQREKRLKRDLARYGMGKGREMTGVPS
ncbi:MAG: NAD(P)H-dependent oxidoreductase [Thermodesulfobacteriota bacterium]